MSTFEVFFYLHENLGDALMPESKLESVQTNQIYFQSFHFPPNPGTWWRSKLGPCLTVILLADCGSGVLFYANYCDLNSSQNGLEPSSISLLLCS